MIGGDNIVALSTPVGKSAIAVIRLSGESSIECLSKVFLGADLCVQGTHTIHFGKIVDNENHLIDEVLVSIFKKPHSFTKENSAEISCHGSQYIVEQIVSLLLEHGARMAEPGEFTKRAYLNGRFDLVQAEAVADVINSENAIAHRVAMEQLKGGFSSELKRYREKLVEIAALLELELDFAEEDLIFAERTELLNLVSDILDKIYLLLQSFKLGNALKTGVPTVIAGRPNAGKSTLLNALVREDRAIVSSIAGTTRDVLEEYMYIGGLRFRFIDTAGLRNNPENEIEALGIERAKKQIEKADIIMYLFDLAEETIDSIREILVLNECFKAHIIYIGNKIDVAKQEIIQYAKTKGFVLLSMLKHEGLDDLEKRLLEYSKNFEANQNIVVNSRHYEHLLKTKISLLTILDGLKNRIANEFLMQDMRLALYHIGAITGEISNEEILGNIFSKFCIGK